MIRKNECDYSFWELYVAAFNKNPSDEEKEEFHQLPQFRRNMKVKEWAKLAGWKTIRRIGSDFKIYIAFYPDKDYVNSSDTSSS